MNTTNMVNEAEKAAKPLLRNLQEGKDFQILGEALGHTTISIMLEEGEQILMCKGNDLILISISFKKGMVLEKHTTSIPARLVILRGEVIYNTELQRTELKQREEHQIPVDEPHWVEAVEDSVALLIKNRTS